MAVARFHNRRDCLFLSRQSRAAPTAVVCPLRYNVAPQHCVDILGGWCKGTYNLANGQIFNQL